MEELLSNYQNYFSIASSIYFLSFFSLYSVFFFFLLSFLCLCFNEFIVKCASLYLMNGLPLFSPVIPAINKSIIIFSCHEKDPPGVQLTKSSKTK